MTDFTARRTTMVDTQVRTSDVTKFPIIDAMLSVPREEFVPDALREAAYVGENLDLEAGRVVLEPRTLSKMLDAIDVQNDELVLDIGCAFGYSAAVIARIAQAVVALESDPEMAKEAQSALGSLDIDNVIVQQGDLADGAAQHGPYDAIMIEGGAEELPDTILEQLKDGGRIACVFMEGALGVVRVGYKTGGHVDWWDEFNAIAPVLDGFKRKAAFAL